MNERRVVISVDPGVNGTGYAVWEHSIDGSHEVWSSRSVPVMLGEIRPEKVRHNEWTLRFESVVTQFSQLLNQIRDLEDCIGIDIAYFEEPRMFVSAGGHASASSGDLIKLTLLTGGLMAVAVDQGIETDLVPITAWKGQLPKDIVERRLIRYVESLGIHEENEPDWYSEFITGSFRDHVYDAFGIGLYVKGLQP